ncbi:unnamed protein product [Paramecium sonneborni]|uniref:Uncharacterized protein n=1 Tax=Paramecium sonneborni TaxID=65129 RepID=A0A8S1PXS1_9CILI|nr:unnamed protein product [Paramecium sonneborni]
MLTASPHIKSDKPYQQSPQYKKPHPYNPEASISLKNSINLKVDYLSIHFKVWCEELRRHTNIIKNLLLQ